MRFPSFAAAAFVGSDGCRPGFPRSEIRGDALDLPVAIADRVEPAPAMRLLGLLLLGLLRRRAVALGTPGGSLRQRPLGRGRDRLLGRGRGPRLGWLARLHTLYM